jgi:hypothetical protein
MAERVAKLAYRSAMMKISQHLELTPDEWADLPRLVRENIEKLISEGMIDPEEIAAALVNIIRQTEQIRRSQKRTQGFPSTVP